MNARFEMKTFSSIAFGVWVILQLAVGVVSAQTRFDFGSLPLWFEAGQGGAVPSEYTAHGRDSQITISRDGAQFVLGRPGQTAETARMQFVGASAGAAIAGGAEMPARINYLSGNDPSKWQSGLAAFGQVRVSGLYPGINLVYYGNQQRLEYDFDLASGARPESIAIRFAGAQKVLVNGQGELMVQLAGRNIIQHQPVAYQIIGDTRQSVKVGYKMLDADTVAFAVSHYDARLPLVIDPVISYSTFFGGNEADTAWAVAYATNDDSVYIAGQTVSTTITATLRLATPGAYQTNFHGGGTYGDAFVAKFHDLTKVSQLNDLATNLVYCTYIGGSKDDGADALAVDSTGHAFVAGLTFSTDFPVTNYITFQRPNGQIFNGSTNQGRYDSALSEYPPDVFVSELDPNGAHLIFSTYLGGEEFNVPLGLVLDPADDVFVTGYTSSLGFPVTTNAWQPKLRSVYNSYTKYICYNAFVTEIGTNAANGKTLTYSSYLGGTNQDIAYAIAYHNGFVAVAGSTTSSNFPTFNAIHQAVFTISNSIVVGSHIYDGTLLNDSYNNINNILQIAPYNSDGFVTLFPASGTTLSTPLYSTLLGGTNVDVAYAVAFDPAGNVDVVGGTASVNFPVYWSPGQLPLPSYVLTNTVGFFVTNCFLTQLQYNGSRATIAYSQVFGGTGNDVAQGVAVDAAGNVFITGTTMSITNVLSNPTNLFGALYQTNSGVVNVLVDAFQAGFSNVLYAADFGSSTEDAGYGIAVDPNDGVYVVGQTMAAYNSSILFPVFNAWESVLPDSNNGFLTKILPQVSTPPLLSISSPGTNLVVSWTASPLAQVYTNPFVLQVSSNLLASPAWVTVPQSPLVTKIVTGAYTNESYEYQFLAPTNSDLFFRLQSITY
jgi:hypothetical protein